MGEAADWLQLSPEWHNYLQQVSYLLLAFGRNKIRRPAWNTREMHSLKFGHFYIYFSRYLVFEYNIIGNDSFTRWLM